MHSNNALGNFFFNSIYIFLTTPPIHPEINPQKEPVLQQQQNNASVKEETDV